MAIEVENGAQVQTATFDGQLFAEARPDVPIKAKCANSISPSTTLGALKKLSLDSQSDPNTIWG